MKHLNEFAIFDNLQQGIHFEEFENGLNIIKQIIKDEQFDRKSDSYMGFLNISQDFFIDPQQFKDFYKHIDVFEPILNKLGFVIESGHTIDEIVIEEAEEEEEFYSGVSQPYFAQSYPSRLKQYKAD